MPEVLPFVISAVVDSMIYGPFALISVVTLYRLWTYHIHYSRPLQMAMSLILLFLLLSVSLSLEFAVLFPAVSRPDRLETSLSLVLIVLEGTTLMMSFVVITWRSMMDFPGPFEAKDIIAAFVATLLGVMPSPFRSGMTILIFWIAFSALLSAGRTSSHTYTVVALLLLRAMSMLLGLVSALILFLITLRSFESVPDSTNSSLRKQFSKTEVSMHGPSLVVEASSHRQRTGNVTPSDHSDLLDANTETSQLPADSGMSAQTSGSSTPAPLFVHGDVSSSRSLSPLPRREDIVMNADIIAMASNMSSSRIQNQSSLYETSLLASAESLPTSSISILSRPEIVSSTSNNETRTTPYFLQDQDRFSSSTVSYPPSYHTYASSRTIPSPSNFSSMFHVPSMLPRSPPVPPRPVRLRPAQALAQHDSAGIATVNDRSAVDVNDRTFSSRSSFSSAPTYRTSESIGS
ncbi:hypothetical protein K435DRAFT_171088 [Dendrothele bispora CBS 962.96]|uniref:Uncharacterized protein n=1 Tax=Dendrothele bispora (strain CBS 962.96) TaxID=1314807 RepID=A0A4S8MWW8_DENBC|nr:hypothetical protein K435DRAFT_171088 [Dendrothele bispora CBS 962.96]